MKENEFKNKKIYVDKNENFRTELFELNRPKPGFNV